jgi:hypothetical protein
MATGECTAETIHDSIVQAANYEVDGIQLEVVEAAVRGEKEDAAGVGLGKITLRMAGDSMPAPQYPTTGSGVR